MQQQKSGPRDLDLDIFVSGQCLYPAQAEWFAVNTISYVDMYRCISLFALKAGRHILAFFERCGADLESSVLR